MKPVFRTDILMLILFASSLYTGIELHYAGDFQSHKVWHNWAMVHSIINTLLLIVAAIHIKQHWGWYKSFFKKSASKSRVTKLLTVIFALTALSGIALLIFSRGQGTSLGMIHYVCGLAFGAIGTGHFAKRWKVFRKGVTK